VSATVDTQDALIAALGGGRILSMAQVKGGDLYTRSDGVSFNRGNWNNHVSQSQACALGARDIRL
jgi:hypothetical protein